MTGKVGTFSSYPNGFAGGLLLDGLSTHKTHAGKVFHVAKGSGGTRAATVNAKDASDGNVGTFLAPFKTLAYAVEQCVDGRGDVIVCHPGMIDAVEASIDVEAGNVTILGLGTGNDRPQITPGVIDAIDVEGDNVTIQNMYFNEADAEVAAGGGNVDVVGAGFRLLGCQMDLGTHDDRPVTVAATGEVPVFQGNRVVVTADGTESWLDIEGVIDNLVVTDNVFVTSVANFDDAAVDAEASAITNTFLKDNVTLGGGTLFTGTGAVGTVQDGLAAVKEVTMVDSVGMAHASIFTIDGTVALHALYNVATTDGDGSEDLVVATEGGTTLWALAEVHAANAGDVLSAASIGAVPSIAAAAAQEGLSTWESPIVITGAEGVIDLTTAGAGSGLGTFIAVWEPLSTGAEILSAKA